jgi:hypothetical protein
VSPAALDERTQDKVQQKLLRDRADKVRALVGFELTAYLANAANVAEFSQWLDKVDPLVRDAASRRLGTVLRLAEPFRRGMALTCLKSWLREPDAGLGGGCPADIVRQSVDDAGAVHLLSSAAAYLRTID